VERKPIVKNPYLRVLIYIPLILFIYFCAAFFFAALYLLVRARPPEVTPESPFQPTAFLEIVMIMTSLALIAFTLLFWRYFDRKELRSFGLAVDVRSILHFLLGGTIAALIVGAAFTVNYLLGNYEIAAYNFKGAAERVPPFVAYYFFFFFCAGLFEEVMLRGYCLQTLAERGRILMAVVASSVLFSVMHLAQTAPSSAPVAVIGLVNIFLVGAVFCFQFLWSKTLWLPTGFHVFWNFIMNSILSVPVSGVRLRTLFDVRTGGTHKLLTGGTFGLEGSILITVMLIIVLAVHAALYFRRAGPLQGPAAKTTASEETDIPNARNEP